MFRNLDKANDKMTCKKGATMKNKLEMCEHGLIKKACAKCSESGDFSCKSQSTGSLADMTLEEAEVLAKQTDYAFDLCDCDGLNPVNWADACAFFLEGYLHARKQANVKHDLQGN